MVSEMRAKVVDDMKVAHLRVPVPPAAVCLW